MTLFRLKKEFWQPFALICLLIVAFLIRFNYAKQYPVWIDEATLVVESWRPYKQLFLLDYWDTAHPPLYNLIVKFISNIATYPKSIRLFSQIFGTLSLIYLYKLTKLISKSHRSALIAVILTTFSGFHVFLSAFNRPYGLQQFLILGFIYYWLLILSKKNKKTFYKLLLFSFLATLTDYSFIWIIVSCNLTLGIYYLSSIFKPINHRDTLLKYLKIVSATTLPFLLWLPIFINKLKSAVGLEDYISSYFYLKPVKFVGFIYKNMIYVSHDENFYVYLTFAVIILAIYLLIEFIKNKEKNSKFYLFLFVLFTVPPIISLITTYLFSPIFSVKNLFPISYVLLVILGITLGKYLWSANSYLAITVTLLIIGFQIININSIIKININQNYSLEILEHRSKLRQQNLSKLPVLLGSDFIQYGALWRYYLNCFDSNESNKYTSVYTLPNKIRGKFVLLTQSPQQVFLSNIRCINQNLTTNQIQTFLCEN